MTSIAISYARFSSLGQADGDSLRRQSEAAEKYATDHNLVLDRALSFRDLGVSAYDQSNIKKGALGLFLQAVEKGKVPIGATLIIESFDRLSRATPLDALSIFTDILNAGLNLVTLVDGAHYSRVSVGGNPGQLMMSIVMMYRAHEESATKSKRVKAAWDNKKKLAVETGKIMTKKTPHWVVALPDKSAFELIPDRARLALRIIEMSEKGNGGATILRALHADNIPAWSTSGKWEPSYIQKLLTSPALYGAIDIDGEIKEGYYPPVISHERFLMLQALRSARRTRKSSNRKGRLVTNLFSGLTKCGYCGAAMNVTGYKSLKTGYERKSLACHGARIGASNCRMRVWFMDELEPSMLFWLSGIDYSKILGIKGKGDLEEQREQLAALEHQAAGTAAKIERIEVAIEDGATSMAPRLEMRRQELDSLSKLIIDQRKKVEVLTAQEGGGASRMKGLVLLFKALKHTTDEAQLRALREQISAGISNVVERVELFPGGRSFDGPKEERYAVVTFRNGFVQTIDADEI